MKIISQCKSLFTQNRGVILSFALVAYSLTGFLVNDKLIFLSRLKTRMPPQVCLALDNQVNCPQGVIVTQIVSVSQVLLYFALFLLVWCVFYERFLAPKQVSTLPETGASNKNSDD